MDHFNAEVGNKMSLAGRKKEELSLSILFVIAMLVSTIGLGSYPALIPSLTRPMLPQSIRQKPVKRSSYPKPTRPVRALAPSRSAPRTLNTIIRKYTKTGIPFQMYL